MARRNAMNERYQKNTAPAGKTRRSAASAKPKRDAGKSSAPAKKTASSRGPLVINPPTEEFRRLRRLWWMLLLASVIFTFSSLAVRQWFGQTTLANILLGIGYAGIFGALYLDWTKLRKMRREWAELQRTGKVPPQHDESGKGESKTAAKNKSDDDGA